MHILHAHIYNNNNNSSYFSLSRYFTHMNDSVSVSLRCLHNTKTFYSRFKRTFSNTEFLEIELFCRSLFLLYYYYTCGVIIILMVYLYY